MVKMGIITCLQEKIGIKSISKRVSKKYREMKKAQGNLAKNPVLTP